ncbi:MAG: farnesyl diphosphate synthase [Pseudohongiella sp.]|uniref:polyprenyl synthetase family protein n=1 Tax=Pseudohongiella sp. TaxID=1979412 RepID=UPI0034A0AE4C
MSQVSQTDLPAFLRDCQQRCAEQMALHLNNLPYMPLRLTEAMRYSTLLGGKRIRPALVYASADAVADSTPADADVAACAIEFMHCYSLVHDDLPAMDNDDLRRGKPTLHRAFDEATAILTGDALQALAFQIIGDADKIKGELRLRMLRVLAQSAGCQGMIAGQGIDLAAVGKSLNVDELETMHRLKTGALISASVELGALSAGCTEPQTLEALRRYARCIGLAFQVQDDILDVISDTAVLGKTQGADEARNKPTYVSLLGLDGARRKAGILVAEAAEALSSLGPRARMLDAIAGYITSRRH